MGLNVEIKKGYYDEIRNSLVEKGAADEPFLDDILHTFGIVQGNEYILINNELNEDLNSFFNLSMFIDNYYEIKDSFYCFLRPNMETLPTGIEIEDAQEKLGVEFDIKED